MSKIIEKYQTNNDERITSITMDVKEIIFLMSGGNPGSIMVLSKMIEVEPLEAFMKILALDGRGVHDGNIFMMYKDDCGEDINVFMENI